MKVFLNKRREKDNFLANMVPLFIALIGSVGVRYQSISGN